MSFTENTGNVPMTLQQIAAKAPSVFTTKPWHEVSDRYKFIPTFKVMEALQGEGWQVMAARQSNARLFNTEYTKHELRFRQAGAPLVAGELYPEITLTNAHGKVSAPYVLDAAFLRLICLNGLTAADSTVEKVKVLHKGKNVLDDVRFSAARIVEQFPKLIENISIMKDIELTPDDKEVFAYGAALLKEGYDGETEESEEEIAEKLKVDPLSLLIPKRVEDRGQDLWTTFNIAQEHLVRGGDRAYNEQTGKSRKTREVKSIDNLSRINKGLWLLADAMKGLKLNNK